jgi:hypothetical protein
VAKRHRVEIEKHPDNASLFFDVPFDPKVELGKVRAPVVVTINGFTFRTTIASMGGRTFIGLNRDNRAGTGLKGGETVSVTIALDTEPRVVKPPADLLKALAKNKPAKRAWDELSHTHRREHVEALEQAKKPETRARRLAKILELLEQ